MGILLVINDLSGVNALCVYHEHHARIEHIYVPNHTAVLLHTHLKKLLN